MGSMFSFQDFLQKMMGGQGGQGMGGQSPMMGGGSPMGGGGMQRPGQGQALPGPTPGQPDPNATPYPDDYQGGRIDNGAIGIPIGENDGNDSEPDMDGDDGMMKPSPRKLRQSPFGQSMGRERNLR